MAGLADYHANRIGAGVDYALFRETRDLNALVDAIGNERKAIGAWERIVKLTGGVYHDSE